MKTPPSTYRIFIGAFPTGELAEHIQAARLRWDHKTARITPPHVTIAGTYTRNGLPTPTSEAESITTLSGLHSMVEPFNLVIAGVRSFPPADQPIIYLRIEPTPELLSARQLVMNLIGQDKHNHYIPHLTVAMRLQGEAAKRAYTALHNSEWASNRIIAKISELRLMQRGPTDPAWRCIATFSLTANGHATPCDPPVNP